MRSAKRKVVAIVPAAGEGNRFKVQGSRFKVRKPFVLLADKPILIHTLKVLESSALISHILVIVHPDDMRLASEVIKRYRINKVQQIIPGGSTRTQSVYNGLKNISSNADIVLIHDGARPFITQEIIKQAVSGAGKYGSSVCAVQAISTMKEVDDEFFITLTPDRARFYECQTPQVFRRNIIVKAYKEAVAKGYDGTDDSALVERLGYKVKVVAGSKYNIKLTTPEDMILAEAIYAHRHRI